MEPRSETRRRLLPLITTRQNRHGGLAGRAVPAPERCPRLEARPLRPPPLVDAAGPAECWPGGS